MDCASPPSCPYSRRPSWASSGPAQAAGGDPKDGEETHPTLADRRGSAAWPGCQEDSASISRRSGSARAASFHAPADRRGSEAWPGCQEDRASISRSNGSERVSSFHAASTSPWKECMSGSARSGSPCRAPSVGVPSGAGMPCSRGRGRPSTATLSRGRQDRGERERLHLDRPPKRSQDRERLRLAESTETGLRLRLRGNRPSRGEALRRLPCRPVGPLACLRSALPSVPSERQPSNPPRRDDLERARLRPRLSWCSSLSSRRRCLSTAHTGAARRRPVPA